MNSLHKQGQQPAAALRHPERVSWITSSALGSKPHNGVCEARGRVEFAEPTLRGTLLCGFHFHSAGYRWRLGHDRELSVNLRARAEQAARPHLDHVAAKKVIQPVDGAAAFELDRRADDGAWSIPVKSRMAS